MILAHPNGMHYHNDPECEAVGFGPDEDSYVELTEKEFKARHLRPCPMCVLKNGLTN